MVLSWEVRIMSRNILRYEVVSSTSIDNLKEKVNKLLQEKPDYRPQGGVAIEEQNILSIYYQVMVRPLDRGELDDLEDPYNHFG